MIHVEDSEGEEDELTSAAAAGLLITIAAAGAVMFGYGLFKHFCKKD